MKQIKAKRKLKTTIYKANAKTHFFKELSDIFKDIKKSQFLAMQVAKRDIQAQYRQSFLGFFWAIAPIVNMAIVWIFINKSGAVKFGDIEIPYPLFVIVGLTMWTLFTESVNSPVLNLNQSRGIINKINFPKESLLVAGVYKIIFNAIPKIALMIVFLIYYGIVPHWMALIYFPIYFFTFILLGNAIGIILAPIGLLYTDIGRGITMLFGILMYATPVVYPQPKAMFAKIFEYNPLTPLIVSSRNIITGYPLYQPEVLYYIIPIAFIILSIGLVIFRNSMNIIIEKIS